jgi:DNA-binding beta-propeller fold protein YncE
MAQRGTTVSVINPSDKDFTATTLTGDFDQPFGVAAGVYTGGMYVTNPANNTMTVLSP